MKKNYFLLCVMCFAVLFTACSSDSPDLNLYDRSEIMGTQTGKVKVKLTSGNFAEFDGTASTGFVNSTDNNLALSIFDPVEIGGPIRVSGFRKNAGNNPSEYTFTVNFAEYGNGTFTLTGNEIPEYMREWFSANYDINQVIIKDLKSTTGKYDKATSSISFVMEGSFEGYEEGSATAVVQNKITYTFTDLKK